MLGGEPIEFGRLRFTVTGGRGPLGSDRHDSDLTHIVTAVPHARPEAHGAVVTVPWVRNERAATAGLKTTSYADNVIALARAKEQGALEAIFGNTRGELCEATGSNVFVVVDGVVRTPPLDSGCLAGITRELVLEWCAADGVEVVEEALPLDVLGRGRRGVHHLLDQGRLPGVGRRRPGAGRPRPGDGAGAAGLGRPRRPGGRPVTPEEQRDPDEHHEHEHHLLRDPDDEDDWEWRRRIRASPRWRPLYQGAVLVVGLVMVLGGLALVPLPGPGWLIVILGIAVWASEFEPASRLLEFVKDKVRAWEQWVRGSPGGSRAWSGW